MDFHGSHSSNLTPTGLAHQLIAELTSLANLLSPNRRRIIKKFSDYILQYRSAISDATTLLPLEAALVVIQVEEHANTVYEISELHKRIDELERKIEKLTSVE